MYEYIQDIGFLVVYRQIARTQPPHRPSGICQQGKFIKDPWIIFFSPHLKLPKWCYIKIEKNSTWKSKQNNCFEAQVNGHCWDLQLPCGCLALSQLIYNTNHILHIQNKIENWTMISSQKCRIFWTNQQL